MSGRGPQGSRGRGRGRGDGGLPSQQRDSGDVPSNQDIGRGGRGDGRGGRGDERGGRGGRGDGRGGRGDGRGGRGDGRGAPRGGCSFRKLGDDEYTPGPNIFRWVLRSY